MPQANFHVALFGFPEVSTATVTKENACSSYSTPAFQIYALPTDDGNILYAHRICGRTAITTTRLPGPTRSHCGASDADANGFVSNYYDPTASNGLNTSSSIVKAITKCMKPICAAGSGTGGLQWRLHRRHYLLCEHSLCGAAALAAEANIESGNQQRDHLPQ